MNCSDLSGQNPLHGSDYQGRRDIVELLLARGADVNAKNNRDYTPLDIAAYRGYNEIA